MRYYFYAITALLISIALYAGLIHGPAHAPGSIIVDDIERPGLLEGDYKWKWPFRRTLHGSCKLLRADDRTLIASGLLADGKMHGPWVIYNEAREIVAITSYKDGKRDGRCVILPTPGSSGYVQLYRNGQKIADYRCEVAEAVELSPNGELTSDVKYFIGTSTPRRVERPGSGNVAKEIIHYDESHGVVANETVNKDHTVTINLKDEVITGEAAAQWSAEHK